LVFAAGLYAVPVSAQGDAKPPSIDQVGNWKIIVKNDPLDGKITSLWSPGQREGTSILIALRHKETNWSSKVGFFFSIEQDFQCPYIEADVPSGIVPKKYAFVWWRIDDGPVHTQRYELSCRNGRCAGLSYLWRVLAVDKAGYLERYTKIDQPFPAWQPPTCGTPKFFTAYPLINFFQCFVRVSHFICEHRINAVVPLLRLTSATSIKPF
jgi:hypothetical protein